MATTFATIKPINDPSYWMSQSVDSRMLKSESECFTPPEILGDPEVTANIYCKSRNLPNTDTQNYSTDLR